ncbi:MAG: hypothetical protein ACRD5L_14580, partial [Bryobacteraceae bacterium]
MAAMHIKVKQRAMVRASALAFLLVAGATGFAASSKNASAGVYELKGQRLEARFAVARGSLRVAWVKDLASGAKLAPGEVFSLKLRDGRVIAASAMKLSTGPVEEAVTPIPAASRAAERVAGRRLCADLRTTDNSLSVRWCAVLREGANYLRQEVTLKAASQPVDIAEVRLFDFDAPSAEVVGKV